MEEIGPAENCNPRESDVMEEIGQAENLNPRELTTASVKDFLLPLVPYASSSSASSDSDETCVAPDSDESYVIPVMKSRQVNQIIRIASSSDQDEVSLTGCEEENYSKVGTAGTTSDSESDQDEGNSGHIQRVRKHRIKRDTQSKLNNATIRSEFDTHLGDDPTPKEVSSSSLSASDKENCTKVGTENASLCLSSDSDQEEGNPIPIQRIRKRRVRHHRESKVNDAPNRSESDTDNSTASDTDDLEGEDPTPKEVSNSSLSGSEKENYTNVRTENASSCLSSDSDQDKGNPLPIQRLRKSKVRRHRQIKVNDTPNRSESDTDNSTASGTNDLKEVASTSKKVSNSSLSGIKVCIANNKGRRVWDKRHYCVYCMNAFPKLPRHLEQVHASEKDVAEALSHPKKSKKRKLLFDLLRNKGNHAHNIEVLKSKCGLIIPAKRPTFDVPASDYLPCSQCFGYYIGRDMWKHLKFCIAKELHAEMKKGERHQARCSLLLPISSSASSDFQKNVLGSMIRDEISLVARQDDMINKFGERMYTRLGHEVHQYNYISQKMRELARLLLAIRATDKYEQKTLTDVIRPEHFDTILKSVHTCAGFSASTCKYKTPSLALKLGHSLKKCALILKADAIREGNTQLKMAAENFVELCEIEWSHQVSSSALATLEEKKWNKPDMLPLSEDIIKLHKYLGDISAEAKSQLPLKAAWITLAEATLTKIILFNRRRSGEAQRIKVNEFEQRNTGNINSDVRQSLTNWEQTLCNKLNRIEVKGKRGRKVPVLLTEEMTESLELLMKHRITIGISSENVFVFARSSGGSQMCIRGSDCLRKLAIKSCAKVPANLTSTKLRKQIATVSQIFCLRENELDILAGFLGHDIRVHRDYYRLPEDALQTAKVARLLMLMEKGAVADFKDKTLSEIEVSLDDPSYNDEDDGLGEEEGEEDEGMEEEDEKKEENASCEEEERDVERKKQTGKEGKYERKKQNGSAKGVWTPAETEAIQKHFAKNIRLLKVPRKNECEEFIRKNPLSANQQWKRVKFKVYSIIQRNKKY